MTARRSPNRVTFQRGGQPFSLCRSRNRFAIRFRDGYSVENAGSRLAAQLELRSTVRFVRRIPGRQLSIYQCRPADRDHAMARFRELAGREVVYVSHVLARSDDEDACGTEITPDNSFFAEFVRTPSAQAITLVEWEHRVRAIWRFPERPSGIVFQLTEHARENPIKIANKLQRTKKFRTVEPCLVEAKVARAIPGDAAFAKQWHLLNTGQEGGTAGADCNATAAWDYSWGDPKVTVAIIDDGFDLGHPDLGGPGKYRDPYDATQRDRDPSPEDFEENHGTSVAGVAIGSREAGIAVGVAPDCSWMPIRHAGELGDYEEALAFHHAYRQRADVISCSWGPYDAEENRFWPMPSLTRYVIDLCAEEGRGGKGIPVLFAAGNGNERVELDGYANHHNVIAIAACTNKDRKANYSDYGRNVWVTAPSSGGSLDVFTTDRRGPLGYSWNSDYADDFGGTSAAAPLVAGVIALMLSVNAALTVAQIRRILKETAVKIRRNVPRNNYRDTWGNQYSDRYDARGHSLVYGWGRVNAGAAVAAAFALSRRRRRKKVARR